MLCRNSFQIPSPVRGLTFYFDSISAEIFRFSKTGTFFGRRYRVTSQIESPATIGRANL